MRLFGAFERLVDVYPAAEPETPPRGFFAFLWQCTRGVRPWILWMTVCTAITGAFEASAVLGARRRGRLARNGATAAADERARRALLLLGRDSPGQPARVALQTLLKHQALAGNLPMLLRWSFHRHMLGQSLAFYADEFAGRVAPKVMQTALAVRDVWMLLADIIVFVVIYVAR